MGDLRERSTNESSFCIPRVREIYVMIRKRKQTKKTGPLVLYRASLFLFLLFLHFGPVCRGAFTKSRSRHAAFSGRGGSGEFAPFPALVHGGKVFRERLRGTAEDDASRFCRGDAFGLAAADVVPLIFRHEGQDLEDDVGDEGAQQVFPAARIEEGHVEDGDVHAFFPGEDAPLFEDLPVVPPEAVDAFHAKEVVFFHAPHERPIPGPVEIAAGLFVCVDARSGDAPRPEGDALSVFVLFPGADPDVAVGIHKLSFLSAEDQVMHFQNP